MKHRDPSQAESEAAFLRTQAEVAQALSGRPDLSVAVGLNRVTDEPLAQRENILISKLLDGKVVAVTRHMRGQVDLAALALKHHSATLHHHHRPSDNRAAAMFDALEQVRLEAIGTAAYPGMKANLAERHNVAFQHHGYDLMQETSDMALPDVVAMIAREAITGEKPPESIRRLVATMRPWVQDAALAHFGNLARAVDRQELFSRIVQDILYDLKLITHRPSNEAGEDGTNQAAEITGHHTDTPDDDSEMEEQSSQSLQSTGEAVDGDEGERQEVKTESDIDGPMEEDASAREKTARASPNRGDFMAAQAVTYHAYTTRFDENRYRRHARPR